MIPFKHIEKIKIAMSCRHKPNSIKTNHTSIPESKPTIQTYPIPQRHTVNHIDINKSSLYQLITPPSRTLLNSPPNIPLRKHRSLAPTLDLTLQLLTNNRNIHQSPPEQLMRLNKVPCSRRIQQLLPCTLTNHHPMRRTSMVPVPLRHDLRNEIVRGKFHRRRRRRLGIFRRSRLSKRVGCRAQDLVLGFVFLQFVSETLVLGS